MLFMKGNISETISSVKKILLRLGRLYLENAKLTVAEKLTVVFSAATLLLIVLGLYAYVSMTIDRSRIRSGKTVVRASGDGMQL